MRWQDSMAEHPALKGQTIDILFLDATYAKPQHTHPPQVPALDPVAALRLSYEAPGSSAPRRLRMQDECIALMAKLMRQHAERNPQTLFVVRLCPSLRAAATPARLPA